MKIWAKTTEFSEGKYLVVRRDGSTPEWPHFVIGGYDPNGPAGLRAYSDQALINGLDLDYCKSIRELAHDFEQLSGTPKAVAVADPDAPPHRTDNPIVLAMMRGETDVATIVAEHAAMVETLETVRDWMEDDSDRAPPRHAVRTTLAQLKATS